MSAKSEKKMSTSAKKERKASISENKEKKEKKVSISDNKEKKEPKKVSIMEPPPRVKPPVDTISPLPVSSRISVIAPPKFVSSSLSRLVF